MPARQSTYPTSIISDISSLQSVSTANTTSDGTGTIVITGTPSLMIDRDVSTEFKVVANANGQFGQGTAEILIDYGKVWFNCAVNAKFNMDVSGGTATQTFDYSLNGTDWVTLSAQQGTTPTLGGQVLAMRYLRFRTHATSSGATIWAEVYECRVMGG